MFSGKTSELIRRLSLAANHGLVVRALKPVADARAVLHLRSHSGLAFPASRLSGPSELADMAESIDVLGIDEIQFLDPSAIHYLEAAARGRTRVIGAGLDRDFRGEAFEFTERARDLASDVSVLKATCTRCGSAATLTQRVIDGRPAPRDDARIRIGGAELYEPRCATCHAQEASSAPPESDETRQSTRQSTLVRA